MVTVSRKSRLKGKVAVTLLGLGFPLLDLDLQDLYKERVKMTFCNKL